MSDVGNDPREEIACVGRKVVAVLGESVSVSWNASFRLHDDESSPTDGRRLLQPSSRGPSAVRLRYRHRSILA